MTKKAKQRSNSQAQGAELTDEELARAVGGRRHKEKERDRPDAPPAGQSLAGLAGGQPTDWRAVAESNGIESPRSLQPGEMVMMELAGIPGITKP